MTTLESLSPRLRTNDRVPELVAFAGVIGFPSSADFLGAVAGIVGDTGAGTEAIELGTSTLRGSGSASTDFGGSTTGAAVIGPAGRGAGTGDGGGGCAIVSLPRTSITKRSGSRRVKLVTLLTFPTSNTILTVELSY